MAKKNFDKDLQTLLFINITVLILILSFFNLLSNKKSKVQVLGTESNNDYWVEIVRKHPTYRDAWIELGRLDKVEEIDPNYTMP